MRDFIQFAQFKKREASNLTKSITPPWGFSCFFSCRNDTKSHKASQMEDKGMLSLSEHQNSDRNFWCGILNYPHFGYYLWKHKSKGGFWFYCINYQYGIIRILEQKERLLYTELFLNTAVIFVLPEWMNYKTILGRTIFFNPFMTEAVII